MNSALLSYGTLAGAILFELTATNFLQRSEHFTRALPTAAALGLYAVSFYLLSQALRWIPLGIAYATWSGVGLVLTAALGVFVFKHPLDAAALLGLGFIVVGVLLMNVVSKSMVH